jgi:hypothetical protein
MKPIMKSRAVDVIRGFMMALVPLTFITCKNLTVADENASSLSDLQTNPTPASIAAAATGVIAGYRLLDDSRSVGYTELTSMMGREQYTLDRSFPPDPPRRLFGPKAALVNSPSAQSFVWTDMYKNVAQENALLGVVTGTSILSAQDKAALQGLILTFQALDFLIVININDQSGAVIDVKSDLSGPPAPIATKAQVFDRIAKLLDSARTFLQAAGPAFPMPVGNGLIGFNTPATFVKVNRAIKARVDVYMGQYASALTNLTQSFVDTLAALSLGAYNSYSTTSGDRQNIYYDPQSALFFAHASIYQRAQLQADGVTLDARALAKALPIAPRTQDGIPVSFRLTVWNTATTPIPIIRNEELILLRAEANLGSGDAAAALPDINFIRRTSGKLAPISGPTWAGMSADAQLNELLYEKRYSLWSEGGHSWIDYRRYGKLALLPHDLPGELVFPYYPLIDPECTIRKPTPVGCTPVDGF